MICISSFCKDISITIVIFYTSGILFQMFIFSISNMYKLLVYNTPAEKCTTAYNRVTLSVNRSGVSRKGIGLSTEIFRLDFFLYFHVRSPEWCVGVPRVDLELGVAGCVDGTCGQYGVCQEYISGVYIFSACKCFAGEILSLCYNNCLNYILMLV